MNVRRELSRREPSLRNLMLREWQTRGPGVASRDNLCMTSVSSGPPWAGGRYRARRPVVTLLLVLGSVATLLGSFAWWLDRQALSPSGWQRTSSQLIASPRIRRGVATFAVSELFAQTHVASTLRAALGPAVAEPALQALQSLGRQLATSILATRSAAVVWNTANRQAHRELLAILDHGGQHGEVALNLTPLLLDLVRALQRSAPLQGLPATSRSQLFALGSPRAGALPILSAEQVDKARTAVNVLRGLSVALAIAAIALLGGAVGLAGGWRAGALAWAGICLIAAAALIFAARLVVAPALAGALVSSSAYRPAARAAWSISTTELRATAVSILAVGGALLLVGLVARATRRRA
jgi:hypothetical protein